MSSLPPLNALRAFDAAGRHLNFRIAAEELGVTQGAVAQQVRLLEDHLAMPLFERLPKGLAFTAAGRGFHGRVASAFAELREATRSLRPDAGKVLISVTPTFAAKWLIPNLPAFSECHPDIDLRILATERVSSFHGDGIDLAIRQGAPPFGAAVEARLLFAHELVAVAAPTLVGGQQLPLAPGALARMPKLHDAHDAWPAFLARLGVRDGGTRGLRLSQTALAIDAAISGQGVALVGRVLAARDIAAGHLVQVCETRLTGRTGFFLLALKGNRNRDADRVADWLLSATGAER